MFVILVDSLCNHPFHGSSQAVKLFVFSIHFFTCKAKCFLEVLCGQIGSKFHLLR
jgi:hypothetical protein